MPSAKTAFISYSNNQRDLAASVCEFLERNGYFCWIAPRDMMSGRPYGEEILAAIRSVAAFVVILSAKASSSPHVRRELEFATSCNLPLVPIISESFSIPDSVRYYLGDYHRIEATDNLQEALDRLLGAISPLAGIRPSQSQPHSKELVNPLNLNPRVPQRFALIISKADGSSTTYPLAATRITVGRSQDSDIVIQDRRFSRSHFGLNANAHLDTYDLMDFGAVNGVFLNGVRVEGTEALDPLDRFSVGETTFEFVAYQADL